MTALAFLLALGVLITVHEWGHYRVAVACRVKVLTFSIGFGKSLLRWKSRNPHAGQDTEFCISLIPLGGYVKMLDEQEGDVPPQDAHMAFNRQPLWARAAIVLAGPVANLLLAVFLYAAAFCLGQYETQATLAAPVVGSVAEVAGLRSGDTVLRVGASVDDLQDVASLDALRWWLLQNDASPIYLDVQPQRKESSRIISLPVLAQEEASKNANTWQALGFNGAWSRAVLGEVQHGKPADIAGLRKGDEVLRIDGNVLTDATAVRAAVRASGQYQSPTTQVWQISRDGRLMQVAVTPERVSEGSQYIGRIGAQVGEPPAKVWVQYGLLDGFMQAAAKTRDVIVMTLDMLWRLLTGRASLDNLSGPLTMADYAGRSASVGMAAYLSYLALVSVSLGVFNLLPLPMLDGGHLLYYLYEACTGRPPSPIWLESMQRVGLAVLVALMIFSLFNDVVRLGWLP
jgi:regulator of sigma E protease